MKRNGNCRTQAGWALTLLIFLVGFVIGAAAIGSIAWATGRFKERAPHGVIPPATKPQTVSTASPNAALPHPESAVGPQAALPHSSAAPARTAAPAAPVLQPGHAAATVPVPAPGRPAGHS